jgi:hypothetical protein
MAVNFNDIFTSIGMRAVHVNPQNLVYDPTSGIFPDMAMIHVPRPDFRVGGGSDALGAGVFPEAAFFTENRSAQRKGV